MIGKKLLSAPLAVVALLLAMPASGQSTVSTNDIQRLQDQVFQASTDISRLRDRDASLAA